jgi:hypothetical protein
MNLLCFEHIFGYIIIFAKSTNLLFLTISFNVDHELEDEKSVNNFQNIRALVSGIELFKDKSLVK